MLAVLLIISICFSVPARAQVAGGTLSGTITDPSDKFVPQAQISIRNVATGITTTVTTNSDGFYIAANLLPGEYQVTVSANGFATEARKGISLTVGAQQVFNLTLQVGSAAKTVVEVTTEAPAVQLASSDISAVVTANTVRELPLNGRSWTDLATLQPGVGAIQTQPSFAVGADRGNRGFGSQLSISGARPQQNNYRLDAISVNDYANGSPGSVLGGSLGVDAIQEFSVLTSNYSAEYGKTSGGVVNAITRSGTNAFHGSVYEFLRNSALDARNFFDAAKIPPFKRNQFGGAVGGPILKNRTFFFADFEAIRQSKGISTVTIVPSNNARNGMIHDSKTGNPKTVTVDPSAAKYLTFWPVPKNGDLIGNGDKAFFTFAGQQIVNENFVTTRLDHKLTGKDSLSGTYLFDRTPYTSPDGLNNVLLGSLTSRQIVAVEESHIFSPGFGNSVRFGWNNVYADNDLSVGAINPAAADPSLAAQPGRDAAQVSIGGGFTSFTGGIGGNPTYYYRWNSFQVYDDAFLTRGTHTIKFGGGVERMPLKLTALSNPNGVFQFSTIENFLTNVPSRYNSGLASTLTPRELRQTLFGLYVQDDWRLLRNLTLNLGLRYEMSTVPTEINGKLSNLLALSDASPHLGDPYFQNPTLHNFEPRVGFAWDPFHNGKTALRGGYGIFDVLPLLYQYTLLSSLATPFFQLGSVRAPTLPPGSFFAGGAPLLTGNSLRATFIEPKPKRNYVMQWNLNVQQAIAPSLTAMIGYVGSRGVHQPFRVDDADIVLPTLTSAGYLWPNPVGTGKTVNPNFGSIRAMFYKGRSYFDALEAQAVKRMSHGFQFQGSFTWGKSIDTSSATIAGDAFGNSIASLHFFDPKLGRGLSDFNIGRTLVLNGTWVIPAPKSISGPGKFLVDGWQLGLVFTASDGVPFTPTFGTDGDPLGIKSGNPWDFPNVVGGAGCKSLTNPGNPNNYIKTQCFAIPTAPDQAFYKANCDQTKGKPALLECFNLRGNAGRNILIGPGTTEMDFSVFKNNYIRRISENFNLQFRAEFFNILNHPNFHVPTVPGNTDIFLANGTGNSAAGLLTSTNTTAREIQFAIKIIF